MKKISEPIVFFGSGPVAATSLRFLATIAVIELVITKPRKDHDRHEPPVMAVAQDLGLEILPVNSRSDVTNAIVGSKHKSRLGVVIDFGFIMDSDVIDSFELGIINSHFSLLPEWRGADPISFAILSGQPKTGVSLMLINDKMDEGKIIVQKSLPIAGHDTTPALTDKLIKLSNELLAENLPLYLSDQIKPRMQPHPDRATYSRKLTKDDGRIDWQKSATEIEREIRAFYGWPKSYTKFGNIDVIILEAEIAKDKNLKLGELDIRDKKLVVGCGVDAIQVIRLQPAGKPPMTSEAFLAGYKQRLS